MFDRSYWKRMTFIHLIPYLLYFFGIAFDISAAVTVSGLGLRQAKVPACRGAMYICLVFYVSVKVCVQLFLIERAHAVRYRLKKRLHDALWVVFMLVVFVGFGTIATLAFIAPVDIVDQEDGQCRIGLPRTAVMVLMTYDILINIALTVVFLVLLRPLFRMRSTTHGQTTIRLTEHQFTPPPKFGTQVTSRELSDAPTVETSTTEPPPLQLVTGTATGPNAENIKALIGKTLFGAVVSLNVSYKLELDPGLQAMHLEEAYSSLSCWRASKQLAVESN